MSDVGTLVSTICRQLNSRGWCPRPGTGIAIQKDGKVYMAPDKVPMDSLTTEDLFIFNSKLDKNGEPDVINSFRPKTVSSCGTSMAASPFTKLFLGLFEEKPGAGSIVFSQAVSAVLVTMMNDTKFTIKEQEMISNIMDPVRKEPLGWEDEVVVPIVDNTDDLEVLVESIKTVCKDIKDTNAVLIRNNGIIVWGEDWTQARNMLESYLYLMDLSVEMKKLGLSKEGVVSTAELSVPVIKPVEAVEGGSKQKATEPVANSPKRKKVETQETNKKPDNSYKKPAYVKPVVDLALRKKKAALNRLRQDDIGIGRVPFSSITMSGATGQMNGPRMGPMSGNNMGPASNMGQMAGPSNGNNMDTMNGPNVGPMRNSMDRSMNGPSMGSMRSPSDIGPMSGQSPSNMGPINNQNNRSSMGRSEPMNGPQGMGPMNGPQGIGTLNNLNNMASMGRPGPMNGPQGMGLMNNQNNMGSMGRSGPMNGPQAIGPMNGPQGMGPMNGPPGMGQMNGPSGMGSINSPMGVGPGPSSMGPGPSSMGPGPSNMGPGLNMGPGHNSMGPGPNNMGAGPNNMGPSLNNMGAGPNNMGPSLNNMGPGPNNMGPRSGPSHGPVQGGPRFNERFNKYLKTDKSHGEGGQRGHGDAGGNKRSGDAAGGLPPKSAKFSPKKGPTKSKEKFKSIRPEDY